MWIYLNGHANTSGYASRSLWNWDVAGHASKLWINAEFQDERLGILRKDDSREIAEIQKIVPNFSKISVSYERWRTRSDRFAGMDSRGLTKKRKSTDVALSNRQYLWAFHGHLSSKPSFMQESHLIIRNTKHLWRKLTDMLLTVNFNLMEQLASVDIDNQQKTKALWLMAYSDIQLQ